MVDADAPAPSLSTRILHRDRGLVVIDKPAFLPSTGRTLDDVHSAQFLLGQALSHPVWAVHQLDAETTGINLFVERANLVKRWQDRMRFPRGTKRYLAVVDVVPRHRRFRIDAPLGADHINKRQMVCVDGKPSLSVVDVVATSDAGALLVVEIRTGRTHQVRVHCAHAGVPLVGERRYRTPSDDSFPRHALHAWTLHLDDGTNFCAPIPPDLTTLMSARGLSLPAELSP